MARLVVLYFMSLPSLRFVVVHTYEELLEVWCFAVNVLYVVFWVFLMNCEYHSKSD